jgi:MoaA/NifB/PqqE/SkfB family radical SAM enzyme
MLDREREIGQPYSSVVHVPESIDIEVTGRCEFNCPKCWGSKPCNYERELTAKQWKRIFEKFDDYSDVSYVDRVVITGGEPLLRKDLPEIIDYISDDDNRYITLSTTGIDRYKNLERILNKLSAIGIPIDGPSPEINSFWRSHKKLSDGGLSIAVQVLKMAQISNPELDTTVRTLINHKNINYISKIPDFLESSGIDTSKLSWHLYELNSRTATNDPFITGIITSTNSIGSFAHDPASFQEEIFKAGEKFNQVIIKKMGQAAGRNFFINPGGECRSVTFSKSRNALIERSYGNLRSEFNDTLDMLNSDCDIMTALSSDASFYLKGYDEVENIYNLD